MKSPPIEPIAPSWSPRTFVDWVRRGRRVPDTPQPEDTPAPHIGSPTTASKPPGPLVIEITSVSYANKGDCLMVAAAKDALSRCVPGAILAQRFQLRTLRTAGRLGIRSIAYFNIPSGNAWLRHVCNRLLRTDIVSFLLRLTPLAPYRDVKVVLDISGYSYGDSFGYRKAENDLVRFREARRGGHAIILLPKTYGPFENARGAELMREIVGIADLVFVRDRVSLQHLQHVCPSAKNLILSPDYTSVCAGIHYNRHDILAGRAALIPNYRAIDRVPAHSFSNYVAQMATIYDRLEQEGLKPFVLLHESNEDCRIVDAMKAKNPAITIVEEEDPLALKGIIGRCLLVVSCRLHGVINALTQGVPVVALGWSHKYQEVMSEFGVPEFCIMPPFQEASMHEGVARLIAVTSDRTAFSTTVGQRKEGLVTEVAKMWGLVEGTVYATANGGRAAPLRR